MNNFTGRELRGRKVCLRCKHLYVETDDDDKKICKCDNPVLAPAELVHTTSLHQLALSSNFVKLLAKP